MEILALVDKARPTLTSIQVLRGIAALFVAIGHVIAEFSRLPAFSGGYDENIVQFRFGVDLFFVISGFIMVYTTRGKPRTAAAGGQFLIARFLRISPLYWAATLLTIAIALALPSALNHEGMSAERILTSLFYLPHRNASGDFFPIVGPGWTLNYEMFFYLIFAVTFVLPWRSGIAALVVALGGIVGLGALAPSGNDLIAYYTNAILLEFAFGALLGYAYVRGALNRLERLALPAAAIAIAWIIALHLGGFEHMDQRAFFYGVPATLLVFAAVVADAQGKGLHWPFAMMLGDSSYSIYLTHLFVARAASIVTAKMLPGCPVWLFFVMTLAAVMLVGILTARWFEIPMHHFTSKVFRSGKQKTAA